MSALRLARAATRRDRVIKFAGCYHGHVDALLAERRAPAWPRSASPRRRVSPPASRPTRSSAGTTTSTRSPRPCARYGEGLAAILVEPVAGNMGCVPPAPGFLEALRDALRRDGRAARLRRGDHRLPRRARRRAGALRRDARPDDPRARSSAAACPLAAFGGRADLMERLAPVGDVYQAGHALGQPARDRGRALGAAAACATPAVYDELERLGARLEAGPRAVRPRPARRRDADALLPRRARPRATRTRAAATPSATARSSATCSRDGVYVPPSQFECLFPSLAHSRRGRRRGRSRPSSRRSARP